jgi:hypothetical protein
MNDQHGLLSRGSRSGFRDGGGVVGVVHKPGDGRFILGPQPGEQDGNLEVVVAAIVGLAAHDNALGVDAVGEGLGKLEDDPDFGHQRNGPDGMAQGADGADIVHMVQQTGSAVIVNDGDAVS